MHILCWYKLAAITIKNAAVHPIIHSNLFIAASLEQSACELDWG